MSQHRFRALFAAASFLATDAVRVAVEKEVLSRVDPLAHGGFTDTIDRRHEDNAEADANKVIEDDVQENRLCRNSVAVSTVGHRSECKCESGSYVVGESAACLQAQRRTHFSIAEFEGEGCRCEDEDYTVCSSTVEGSFLRDSDHSADGEQCKCPVGSFLTGTAEVCSTRGERIRKFDPHNYEGCHCSWNYDHLPIWRDHLEAFWRDLLATSNPQGIEPRCQPFIEGSGERGVVFLNHGATACSGWWYLVKEDLLADGWMVIATTHIGHGRAPEIVQGADWSVTDYLEDMPAHGWQYIEYADELNKAMKKYRRDHPDKEMVLVGHSIGGALSANMVIEEPGLWNRLLIMNPFFAPSMLPAFLDRALVAALMSVVMPTMHWVQNGDTVRWSEGCDAIRLQPNGGHGGMCQFSLYHLRSWFELGDIVQRKIENIGTEHGVYAGSLGRQVRGFANRIWTALDGVEQSHSGLKAQLMTSIGDGAVENTNIHYLERVFEQWATDSSFCVLPQEFTHNWVSPVDFPWIDHWWLDAGRSEGGITALGHVANFVKDGTKVPTIGTVSQAEGEAAGDVGLVGDNWCGVRQAR